MDAPSAPRMLGKDNAPVQTRLFCCFCGAKKRGTAFLSKLNTQVQRSVGVFLCNGRSLTCVCRRNVLTRLAIMHFYLLPSVWLIRSRAHRILATHLLRPPFCLPSTPYTSTSNLLDWSKSTQTSTSTIFRNPRSVPEHSCSTRDSIRNDGSPNLCPVFNDLVWGCLGHHQTHHHVIDSAYFLDR